MIDMILNELRKVAHLTGGYLVFDDGFMPWLRIDTGDRTSKENCDDMLDMLTEDIEPNLKLFKVKEWDCDHDTIMIEFEINAEQMITFADIVEVQPLQADPNSLFKFNIVYEREENANIRE